MKNSVITGILLAATILIAGTSSSIAQTQEHAVDSKGRRAIVTKAKGIVLPEFKLGGVTLAEALHQLQIASKQNSPDGKGLNFMTSQEVVAAANPKITLALKNVTLQEATERVAEAAGVRLTVQDYAFAFEAKTDKP